MKLIIDSGATKTEYILLQRSHVIFRYKNGGININYSSDEYVKEVLGDFVSQLDPEYFSAIQNVFYYGAGCGKEQNRKRISTILTHFFSPKHHRVYSDLLAACHALNQNSPGWVAILGTGSASCLYDGIDIVDIAPSLGFLLGDEGSGTYLGKMFLKYYLSNKLPPEIVTVFEKETGDNRETVMRRLYRENQPNRYMADIAQFMGNHRDDKVIHHLCFDAFRNFFQQQCNYYGDHKYGREVKIIGSVGFHFQDIVREAAENQNIVVSKIIAAPGDELINYYSR